MERRNFLKMMGLLSGSSLISACKSEGSKTFISYLVPPEDGVLPGEAAWRPSVCMECPAHCGQLVKLRDDWPIKLEGLPDHPVSQGGLCVRGQAAITRLYHPRRLREPQLKNKSGAFEAISWQEAFSRIREALDASQKAGETSRFYSGRTTGLMRQLKAELCERLSIRQEPEIELYGHRALREGWRLILGRETVPRYLPQDCDFVLTIGADLLDTGLSPVDYTARFTRLKERGGTWWHLGGEPGLTAFAARRRLSLQPGSEPLLLLYLLKNLRPKQEPLLEILSALPALSAPEVAAATGLAEDELRQLSLRLSEAGKPLLISGGSLLEGPSSVLIAVLTGLIQLQLGTIGTSVRLADGEDFASVADLQQQVQWLTKAPAEKTGLVLIAGCNPLFQLPADSAAAKNIRDSRLRVGIGDIPDETLEQMDLLLPLSHSLECWGETRPRPGVLSIHRPCIQPLYDTRGLGETLLGLLRMNPAESEPESFEAWLMERWREELGETDRQKLLERGFVSREVPEWAPEIRAEALVDYLTAASFRPVGEGLRLSIIPSLRTFDGRSRPLELLHEIPDPLSTVSYGGYVSVSAKTAGELELTDRDEVEIRWEGGGTALPVKIQPGLDGQTILVQRDALERLPGWMLPGGAPILSGIEVSLKAGGRRVEDLPILAGSSSQQGRGLIPMEPKEDHELAHSLYPVHRHEPYRWAMAIDLDRCTGCSGCVAACYIENNIPLVGRKEHLKGREMSWLRIEPYYESEGQRFLPMLCQHCHNAPCETVCPVNAAYHNPDGLNVQVYNRCVGTRYCSNNCPYKVRRFNWFKHGWESPQDKQLNPDLIVRGRGIMEKCTFCIQRIRTAKEDAKAQGRQVRDGEFTTACAQSCPAGAIVFGNLLDPDSEVARLARQKRAFQVFKELGTEPAVHYLGRKNG